MDQAKPSPVLKIEKNLDSKLANQIVNFLKKNLDVLAWTHADMVGIKLNIMYHKLNIEPQVKPVHQKWRALDVDRYHAL